MSALPKLPVQRAAVALARAVDTDDDEQIVAAAQALVAKLRRSYAADANIAHAVRRFAP